MHVIQHIEYLHQQHITTIMQSVSQQCTDARSKMNELQQQINKIEDTARKEAFEATQKYIAAVQHLINRHSSTPTPAASHTPYKTCIIKIAKAATSNITQHLTCTNTHTDCETPTHSATQNSSNSTTRISHILRSNSTSNTDT